MSDMAASMDLRAALDLRRRLDAPPVVDRVAGLRAAAKAGGWLQALLKAVRGPGKLSVDEFFYYRLYQRGLSGADIARYVGKRIQSRLHDACNDPRWGAVCHDKALFYTALSGAGLPVPETRLLFDPRGRFGSFETCDDAQALRAFLAEPSNFPLFAKPSDGIYSIGAMSIESSEGGMLTLKGGETVAIDVFITYVTGLTREGYLFQKVVEPDPKLVQVLGGGLSAVRLLVLLGENGPQVESAVLKMPREGSVADNYWRGNLLGALDKETGIIRRVVTGIGEALKEVARHPDTDRPVAGVAIPHWVDLVALARSAAAMFPGIRTQSWDIALGGDGPTLMELNFGGDLNLHQLAHGRGILGPSYIAHLRRCGYKGPLPAAS